MTSVVVIHRHFFTVSEVAKILLGDKADDCDAWEIRSEDGSVILDVVGPVTREISSVQPAKEAAGAEESQAEEEPLKGGPLAQKAGILCGEKAFQTFLEVKTAEAAAELLRTECKVESRAMLDHDEAAGAIFQDIAGKYALWLEGYD